jgi:nicotinamide-nucleotide amidase
MRACILSIGDELVIGRTSDTNAAWIAHELNTLGIRPAEFAIVADDRKAIAQAYARLAAQADVLISTGGLGPTADDLSRFALGDVVTPGEALETDPAAVAHLEWWFRGRSMPASNSLQTQRPRGTRFLPNGAGTAMGIAGAIGACKVYALPGPPREMKRMFAESVMPELERSAGDDVILSEDVIEFGLGESDAAARLGDLMRRDRNPLVGTTAGDSIVAARVIATGPSRETAQALERTVCDIEKHWQPYAFGRSGAALETAVGELLREKKLSLTTAESCTAGLLGSMIVRFPGTSENYIGGWITYSNKLKQQCLGVRCDSLDKFGAVSREVAAEMAHGALRAADADIALSITGIAGPDGGSAEKPVGTVYIGLARKSPAGVDCEVRHFRFSGDRQIVRDRSAKAALQMLRFSLLDERDRPLLWEIDDAAKWRRAAVALGSNVGDRCAHLQFAVDALRHRPDVRDVRTSEPIETEPVGPPGQGRYLNATMSFETSLPPRDLLFVLLGIERQRGRDRSQEARNGPRTLDLDLLLYADVIIDEEGLRVPHPRMHERRFVLEPLAIIEPNWVHPVLHVSVESLARSLVENRAESTGAARAATGRKQ